MPPSLRNTPCFLSTRFVATDASGRAFVSDYTTRQVWVIAADGRSTSLLNADSSPFASPEGVAVDGRGRVIVADRLAHCVKIFGPDLDLVHEFGKKGVSTGRFHEPAGVAAFQDLIYVADYGNHRVQVFGSDGTFRASIGDEGTGPGEFQGPTGVAVDSAGRIYVTEAMGNRLQVFDGADHTLLRTVQWLQFPQGVAVGDDGRVYVAEQRGYRVLTPEARATLGHHVIEGRPTGIAVRGAELFVCTGPMLRAIVQPEAVKDKSKLC
jgi:DNA-binding beta-propeller fold protein YncE